MAKDMSAVYMSMTDEERQKLVRKKAARLWTLRQTHLTYSSKMEIRKLEEQLRWLNAVIAAKAAQLELPL